MHFLFVRRKHQESLTHRPGQKYCLICVEKYGIIILNLESDTANQQLIKLMFRDTRVALSERDARSSREITINILLANKQTN